MLSMTAIAVVRLQSLFGVVILFGVYSLLSASIFVVLDAVDVAFTEAAVGAGISTVLMLATLTGAALVWGTLDMPGFGDPDNPIHHHVADRYVNASPTEVGIPNMVTSVLASYRGYDTMGEVFVVFTALIGVLSLITIRQPRKQLPLTPAADSPDNRPFPILQVMSIILIPFIIVFALYVQFHGDYGPGGGFQAGVIFSSAIILYTLTFGFDDAILLIPPGVVNTLAAVGVLIYAGTGVISLFKGGNFLDYGVLAHDPIHGQHIGILIIELGVGITVASVMIAIFFAFFSRAERPIK